MLSNDFTHVGRLHVIPHKINNNFLAMGGFFDPTDQALVRVNLLMILGTINVLDDLLELTFIQYIPSPRFWKKIDEITYQHVPNRKIIEKILAEMKPLIDSLSD